MHNYENEHILDMISDEFSWPASDRALLAILGHRDFSLRSPADITQFNLDFEYYDAMIKYHYPEFYSVFNAAFYGLSWQELGIPKRTFNWKLKKLENILAHLD